MKTAPQSKETASSRVSILETARKPWFLVSSAVGLVIVLILALGVFQVQKAFIDEVVDEAAPTFVAGPGASGIDGDEVTQDMADGMNEAMADQPATVPADDPQPMAEPTTRRTGTFISRTHETTGTALVLSNGGDRRVLRFEDFATDNGPQLNVYLSTAAPDAPKEQFTQDFVDLGRLKGNIGAQNYDLPTDIDLSKYKTVVIWCVRFSVAFGAAELSEAAA